MRRSLVAVALALMMGGCARGGGPAGEAVDTPVSGARQVERDLSQHERDVEKAADLIP